MADAEFQGSELVSDFRVLLDELLAEEEELADGFFLDAVFHAVEHVAAFLLVFDQWVALCHCAQADAFFQVVHFVEVFAPFGVDDWHEHHSFDVADLCFAADCGYGFFEFCVFGVGVVDECGA